MSFHPFRHTRGFSLIELLVVVFIISLTAGFLLVNISFGSAEDKLSEENLRLQSLLRFAHEQAIIRGEEYGVRFHQTGYRFMRLKNDQWMELNSDRHLTSRELENDMEFELYIEGLEVVLEDATGEAELIKQSQAETAKDNDNNADKETTSDDTASIKPQIFLLSSGELIPDFVSRIRIPGVEVYVEIKGSLNGQYKRFKADE
jgi:general secretion pathway protein H